MIEELSACAGKSLWIELINGRKINGTLLESNMQFIRLQTAEGVVTIPWTAILIISEKVCREEGSEALTEENMDYIAEQMRTEAAKTRINCTAAPGFTCSNQYVCIPPDNCVYTFACPGLYTPAQPQGGGGCTFYFSPGCTYYFQQPCGFNYYQPCGFRYYFLPCGNRFTQPCYFQYQQPCVFQFQQPCYFPFQQPCTYNFQQPCGYQFGCNAPGGFACPGQAFIGIAPGQSKGKKG